MIDELLFKYVSGQADPNEVQEVQQWTRDSEERRKELARLKNIWVLAGLGNEINPERTSREIERILNIIKRLNIREKKKAIRLRFLKYAALLVIAIGLPGAIGYFIAYSSFHSPTDYTEIIVPRGERSTVMLPDGSTVQLNSDSRLRFIPSFNSGKRKVYLQGEGFFKVTPDKTHPFVVETTDLQVEVIGTSFNISSYPNDSLTTTFLQSGKVKINKNKSAPVYLDPHEVYTYNKATNLAFILKVQDQRFSDWTHGRLTIKGETIGVLAKKLERRFNIQIKFGDAEAKNHMYSGSIKDEDLNTLLEALTFASSIKFEREGDLITLYSKN